MSEHVEPDFVAHTEKVGTFFGTMWFAFLVRRENGEEVWRSQPYNVEEDAVRAAHNALFEWTDR